jgi:GTP cyclohydrolase II
MQKIMGTVNIDTICERLNLTTEVVSSFVDLMKKAMRPYSRRIIVKENDVNRYYVIERRGVGVLTTPSGKFWEYNFFIDDQWRKYSVIVKAEMDTETLLPVFHNPNELLVRIDSGCETGQCFGDLTCDCKDQLLKSMEEINKVGEGMVINIPRQDGRGMGLPFKLATLWIQEALGLNTVESATILAPDGVIDVRTYAGAVAVLKFFNIGTEKKINLATNNESKAKIFKENGYELTDFTPIVIDPTINTKKHLEAKQKHFGHKNLIKE